MKITRISVENFKKIVAIDVHPTGAIFNVAGKNAQGKSSTLDAIQAALGGKGSMPDVPVRQGEKSGAIRLELDEGALIVRRTFDTDGKDQLVVEAETEHGSQKFTAPQKILDGLYGAISFDPLAFTRLKPEEQLKTLKGLITLDVDLDQLEHDNKVDYDKRRDINRDVSRMEAELLGLPTYDDVPAEVVPIDDIAAQITKAVEHNTEIEQRKARRAAAEEQKAQLELKVQGLKEQLASAEDLLRHVTEQLEKAEPLPEPIDPTELQKQQEEKRNINVKVMANKHHAQKEALPKIEQDRSAALTKAMEERNKKREDAIAAAEMPVAGLSFADGHVLFNGVPLTQASAAEQLRVSIAIGMAMSPKLKVMLVRDASLVDDDGLKLIAELAEKHEYQFWMETVHPTGAVGIVLEDGAVKDAPTPEPIVEQKPKKPTKEQKAAALEAQKAMLTETVAEVAEAKKTNLFDDIADQLEKTATEKPQEETATQVPEEAEIAPSVEKNPLADSPTGADAFAMALAHSNDADDAEEIIDLIEAKMEDDGKVPWVEDEPADEEEDDDMPQSGPVSFFDDDD